MAQIAGVFVLGQFLEGNVLTPRLVGDRVRLHPVWIIFALLAMGNLFGFIGLLLAIPVAAAAGVLVRYAINIYMREYVEGPEEGDVRAIALVLAGACGIGREDFIVAPCNARVVDRIDAWPEWADPVQYISRARRLRRKPSSLRSGCNAMRPACAGRHH